MKIRSALVGAPALVAALVLAACGGGASGDSSSSAGSSSTGGPANGGGNSAAGAPSSGAGATSSSAGATSGGATSYGGASYGGTGAAPAGSSGASTAGAGGSASGVAGGGGATSGGGSAGAVGSAGAPNVTIPDTKVVMYLPNWNGSFADWATKIDFNKMTHLLLAFGVVKAGSNDWDLGAADGDVQTLAAAAHAKNVKVLVSIGGADDDIGIINQYNTESNIAPLVSNLDAFVKRLDLDGVDVDLERGTDMKSSSNYPEFISTLEATLKPEGKLVTSALAEYIVEDAGTDAKTIATVNSFDFINLMIYSTSMSSYTNELNWWTSKIMAPKNKLTWGIEFTTKLTTDMAAQLTTASKAYGGVMVWEYSQGTEPTLWPAVQGAL